ncbi:MAG: ABC transporter permease [Defluviitaleaceae bacterium]|nr:ABC transporter permease [Defluviitaleaceae bacterium]MCL2835346.1 ABC transporter permease [Defluviitaleaceae bacterium]
MYNRDENEICEASDMTPVSAEHKAFLSRLKKRRVLILATQITLLVAFFALWEIAARQRWIEAFIFSQPSRMLTAFINLSTDGILWRHVFTTVWVTIAGFLLGTIIGTVMAALLWWNRFLSSVLAPYMVVLNALPKTALAPILIVWLGNNVKSIIVTALLISVIVSIITILNGFLHVDPEKIKLIETFCGKKSQTLFKLIIPSNIPTIIAAMKINVGLSFVGVIVGEFLVAQAGLGYLIVYGSQIFRMDWVMLSIVILCIMAAVLYQLIVMLERKFMGWMG